MMHERIGIDLKSMRKYYDIHGISYEDIIRIYITLDKYDYIVKSMILLNTVMMIITI